MDLYWEFSGICTLTSRSVLKEVTDWSDSGHSQRERWNHLEYDLAGIAFLNLHAEPSLCMSSISANAMQPLFKRKRSNPPWCSRKIRTLGGQEKRGRVKIQDPRYPVPKKEEKRGVKTHCHYTMGTNPPLNILLFGLNRGALPALPHMGFFFFLLSLEIWNFIAPDRKSLPFTLQFLTKLVKKPAIIP